MPRALRPDQPGATYHVMNRGGAHRRIYFTTGDGDRFVELIGEAADLHKVSVFAYCLMTNHYHLLVSCPEGGLSKFMHRIGSLYARHHNDRLEQDGPIFRGRFHSLAIDSEEYLARAGRYIHRNPLDITPCPMLHEYPWSSHRYYATDEPAPDWLSTRELLSQIGTPTMYRSFVERDGGRAHVGWAVDTAILEAESDGVTVQHLRKTVMLAMVDRVDEPTAKQLHHLLAYPSPAARHAAMYRMRQHLQRQPHVGAIVDRALQLLRT